MNRFRKQLPAGPFASPFLLLKFLADPIATISGIANRYGDPFFLPTPEGGVVVTGDPEVGSSRVDLQACKLEYSIVSPK